MNLRWSIIVSLCCVLFSVLAGLFSMLGSVSVFSQSDDCYSTKVFLASIYANREQPVIDPKEQEPNDTSSQATGPLHLRITYHGYPNDQQDFYYFDTQLKGQISISVGNLTGNGKKRVQLYYGSVDHLVTFDATEPFDIVRNDQPAGRYLILIYVESGHNSTTPYTLNVTYPAPTPQPTSTLSTPIVLPTCTPTLTLTDTPITTPTPTFTSVPPTPTNTPIPSLTPVKQWCDNFNDGQIDQSRWLVPTDANIIYEQDGVLNLRVTAQQSQASGAWAELGAIPAGQISEVSFTTVLQSFTGNTPGAGGLGVNLEDARIFSVDVGTAPDGTEIEYSLCHTLPCTEYEQSYHPDGTSFPVGIPTPMRIVWTGETTKFFVNDIARVDAPTNHKPITGFHLYAYADKGSVFHVAIDDVCVKYSDTIAPTATPTAAPKPTTQYGYNFEAGTQNWTTSEGTYKYAILETTKQFVYSGIQALRLATELKVKSEQVFRYTEAVAYFKDTTPEGMSSANSYNLTGKSVSCYVYLPPNLAPSGNSQAYIRLFVKDTENRNQYSNALDILPSNVNQWLQLNLTVGQGDSIDPGFDDKQVSALGVRVQLFDQATLTYVGSVYIDHCAIQQP